MSLMRWDVEGIGGIRVDGFHREGWLLKVSPDNNGLVAQWLELLVQFQVVQGSIPCEVILLFGYLGYVSQHMDLTVSMLSMSF